MREQRFFYAPEATKKNELPPEEATHALKVLRLKTGDEMILMDGQGNYYRAEVTAAVNHRCTFRIVGTLPQHRQWKGILHIAISPTKQMERTEWFVEKAVEVGIDKISFVSCDYSQRRIIKTQRLEKIIVAAMKQSHKAWRPLINDITPFHKFIERPSAGRKYIAHCYDDIIRADLFEELMKEPYAGTETTVMIGPEGDFSHNEVEAAIGMNYLPVSLGESRLRTETAALVATVMMRLGNRNYE